MAFSAFCIILLVSSVCAIALLVCIGVHGTGWLIFASVWRIDTAVLALMNMAPNCASAADDMTAQIICKIYSGRCHC